MMWKALLLVTLRPLAHAARPLQPLACLWAHARLSAALQTPVPASSRVLGPVELCGTRRVTLGQRLRLHAGQFWETRDHGSIYLGDDVVLGRGVHLVAHAGVYVGAGTMVGEYASVRDARLDRGADGQRDGALEAAPVVIGRSVCIGCGAVILPGVTIGDGAVVGANAVVTRDVPAGAVFAGVPARLLHPRPAQA
jgi:acetyltransferase-like isoleucine patch superfamily enzyme